MTGREFSVKSSKYGLEAELACLGKNLVNGYSLQLSMVFANSYPLYLYQYAPGIY